MACGHTGPCGPSCGLIERANSLCMVCGCTPCVCGPRQPATTNPFVGPFFAPPMGEMSLRDWFAGMAMNGRLNSQFIRSWEELADDAYQIADATMKRRGE